MCLSSAPAITNCIITNNSGSGISDGYPTITNCVISYNSSYGILDCAGTIKNCILWGNSNDDLYYSYATYSCVEDLNTGTGNISYFPYFADSNSGNYHLLSYSPCIDSGDPNSDYSSEPNDPNNTCINMGAYGNTSQATLASADSDSDSLPDTWELLYWPAVDANDANDDCDSDDINNIDEYYVGLDPNDTDTDDDGMSDSNEINIYNTDPL